MHKISSPIIIIWLPNMYFNVKIVATLGVTLLPVHVLCMPQADITTVNAMRLLFKTPISYILHEIIS